MAKRPDIEAVEMSDHEADVTEAEEPIEIAPLEAAEAAAAAAPEEGFDVYAALMAISAAAYAAGMAIIIHKMGQYSNPETWPLW